MRRLLLMAMMAALLRANAPAFTAGVPPIASRRPDAVVMLEDERGLVALDQTLRELANPFSAMFVAAAPDDVDEGALAFLRRQRGARVVIVFATRGEGGDSPFVADRGNALGMRRTREALQLARAVGADAFFLNLADFGPSASASETLRAWGRDNALARLVRAIRLTRPDVMLTNAGGQSADGRQQAVARLATDAFDAAANAKMAPEAGSEVWQARRLFRRSSEDDASVTLNLAEMNGARGRSYAALGLIAHQQLVSYGGHQDRLTPDRLTSTYKLALATDDPPTSPGDLLNGLPLPDKVRTGVAPPRVGDLPLLESIGQRDRLVAALSERLLEKRVEGDEAAQRERYGAEFFRVLRFTQTLERALALALGVSLDVSATDAVVVPGEKLTIHATFNNGSSQPLAIAFHAPEQLGFAGANVTLATTEPTQVVAGGALTHEFTYDTKGAPLSLPREAHLFDEEYYPLGTTLPGALPGEPFGHRLLVTAEVAVAQVTIPIAALARFDVAPLVEIATVPFALIKDWETPREVELPVRLRNRTPGALAGALWIVPLAVSDEAYEPLRVAFAREDEEVNVRLRLRLPLLKPPLAPDLLLEFRRDKPAPPESLGAAKIAVKPINFAVAESLRVGILSGPDRSLASALDQLGVAYEEIAAERVGRMAHGNPSDKNLASGCDELKRLDTIIVDHFAYAARPELVGLNDCLLRYARAGGNLVVLAQQAGDFNLLRAPFAPFTLTLSEDRLTAERAPVQLLDSAHPLLTKPNVIAAGDFEGWVTERAAFVPRAWATDYAPLLEAADPGGEASRGTLLVSRTGEGWFVFTTLSLNRQWRAGVPGAYRLLANLVSLPKVGKPQ
ncbi:MAG TPA: PIG-L family deacetylase [Blastocatellia bacterium]|nr:PIG-L family deacetylase [Blastocatellia bacterium]